VPLKAGRWFDLGDQRDGAPVVVISESMAAEWWPAESAVGKFVRLNGEASTRRIVGVIGDVGLAHRSAEPLKSMYLPIAQHYPVPEHELSVSVRAGVADRESVKARVRAVTDAVDPMMATSGPQSFREQVDRYLSLQWLMLRFLAAIVAGSVLLLVVGLGSVFMHFLVASRRDFAIRVALGASRSTLLHLLLKQVAIPVVCGVAVGWGMSQLAQLVLADMVARPASTSLAIESSAATGMVILCVVVALVNPAMAALRITPRDVLTSD
jgi:hypothetical protein